MKCAIYARYSSDNQKETSIEDQIWECRNYIRRQGWAFAEDQVYTDYALSGADNSRPGYLSLKDAAQRRLFDAVLVDDLSRLGRDAAESISAFREFQVNGVHIISVADGIDTSSTAGKLPLYFKGIMNEIFLDDLKAKVRRGLKGQVLRGYSAGGRVFGYRYIPEYDPCGTLDKFGRPKRIGVRIEIDDKEAEVIREIFELAERGYGQRFIANRLNEEGCVSPHSSTAGRSGHWSKSTIYSVLHQKRYLGEWTWNVHRMVRLPGKKTRSRVSNPEAEWVQRNCPELQIITPELWHAVHVGSKGSGLRLMKASRNKSFYLLSGLLKCAECGRTLIVNNSGKYSAYMCSGYKNGGTSVCGNNHRINRSEIESKLVDEIKRAFSDPRLLKVVYDKFTAKVATYLNQRTRLQSELESRRNELRVQTRHLLDFISAGDSSHSVRSRLSELEAELGGIEAALGVVDGNSSQTLNVSMDDVASMILDLLNKSSKAGTSTTEINHALKQVFGQPLAVKWIENHGTIRHEISGELKPFNYLQLPAFPTSGSGTGNRTPV